MKRSFHELNTTLALEYPPLTQETASVSNTTSNHKSVKITQVAKPKRGINSFLTYREMHDLLFPQLDYSRHHYGNYNYQNTTTNNQAFTEPNSISWGNNRQGCVEYLHLPVTTKAPDLLACTLTLEDLVNKQSDISNLSVISSRPASALSNPDTRQTMSNQLIFKGGKSVHHFINQTNADMTLFFNVSRPRHNLPWDQNSQNNTMPASLSLRSKSKDYPMRNGVFNPTATGTNEDEVQDPMFKLSYSDTRLNTRWRVSQTKTVRLGPGDECTYTVNHPAFKFTEANWVTLIANNSPIFVPFATSVLTVRCLTEMAHSADYSGLSFGKGIINHHQKDYYSMKALPYSKIYNKFSDYDILTSAGNDRIMNEEEGVEVALDAL